MQYVHHPCLRLVSNVTTSVDTATKEGDRDKDTYTTYQSSPRDMSAPQQDHITILHVRQPGLYVMQLQRLSLQQNSKAACFTTDKLHERRFKNTAYKETTKKDFQVANTLVHRAAAPPLLSFDKIEDYWLHTLENVPDTQDCIKITRYYKKMDRRQIRSINYESLQD